MKTKKNSIENSDLGFDFVELIKIEYLKRSKKNPKYSLRAFSKFLSLNHGTLSQIIQRKRKLTKRTVLKVSEMLRLEPDITEKYLKEMGANEASNKTYEQLTLDTYRILSEWFHHAIFELVTVKKSDQTPKNIAKLLSISVEQAKDALERLVRVKLLEIGKDKRYRQTKNLITSTGFEFTNEAFRTLQRGFMERSMSALERVSFEQRDHSAVTMAINSQRLPEVKRRVKKFRRALCDDLQAETTRDSVYQLIISFFPLTAFESSGDLKT